MDCKINNLLDTPTEQSILNSLGLNDFDSKLTTITLIDQHLCIQNEVETTCKDFKNDNPNDSFEKIKVTKYIESFLENNSCKKRGRKSNQTKSLISSYKEDTHDETKMRFGNRYVKKDSDEYHICRIRNNAAVKETRKKNSLKQKQINMQIEAVKKENLNLKEKINSLKEEIDHLRFMKNSKI